MAGASGASGFMLHVKHVMARPLTHIDGAGSSGVLVSCEP